MNTIQITKAARPTAVILSALDVRVLADRPDVTDSRRGYLKGVAEEIAELNHSNGNPFYRWVALVTPSEHGLNVDPVVNGKFELLRSQVPNPNLD